MTEARRHRSASAPGRSTARGAQSGRRGNADPGDAADAGYAIALTLRLPRVRLSVPAARHLTGHTLRQVGAAAGDVADVELALTEACTNVLDHAGPGDTYDVCLTIRSGCCELQIIDVGPGFTRDQGTAGEPWAERGRGLLLIRALMDDVEIASAPDRGTLVTLTKVLELDEASPARSLLAERRGTGPPSR